MTKDQIAEELLALSYKMQDIAVAMDYYGGFAEWARHSEELMGAASVAKQWSSEIAKEA